MGQSIFTHLELQDFSISLEKLALFSAFLSFCWIEFYLIRNEDNRDFDGGGAARNFGQVNIWRRDGCMYDSWRRGQPLHQYRGCSCSCITNCVGNYGTRSDEEDEVCSQVLQGIAPKK